MPRVARLSIAPVRGLGLQHPDAIELTESGVLNDRRFYLIDAHGRLLDRLRIGALCRIFARTDADATWLRLSFPDGRVIGGDVTLDEPVRTEIYNREAIGRVVGGPWAAALSEFVGAPVLLVRCDKPGGTRIRPGETQVRNQVSLLSDGSLGELARQLGVERVDGRRFRMLIELEGAGPHEEDGWIGDCVRIGAAVVRPLGDVGRCVVTKCDPDTGTSDLDTLGALARYRRDGRTEPLPLGVYGEVVEPGRVSVGDAVGV